MDRPERGIAREFLILRSRLELLRGNYNEASHLAQSAVHVSQGSALSGQALLNLSSIYGFGGFADESVSLAEQALSAAFAQAQYSIAQATIAMWESGRVGRLDSIADQLANLAEQQDLAGHPALCRDYQVEPLERLALARRYS